MKKLPLGVCQTQLIPVSTNPFAPPACEAVDLELSAPRGQHLDLQGPWSGQIVLSGSDRQTGTHRANQRQTGE